MFRFALGQLVSIAASGEFGSILGRAEYQDQPPQYWLRYRCADGRAVEAWWSEGALSTYMLKKPVTKSLPPKGKKK